MAKVAPKSTELCPSCGQRLPAPLGAKERLYRKYAAKRGFSQAQIARELGVSEQVVGFLFSGRQGAGNRYQGLKGVGGREALAVRVCRLLRIPQIEFKRAYTEDRLEEEAAQLDLLFTPSRRGRISCSPNMRRKQQLHVLGVTEKSDLPLISSATA